MVEESGILELKSFFEPKSVAVVGASRDIRKAGHILLRNLLSFGFKGRVVPVNPNTQQILGLKAYSRVDLIPGDVETAIIVTPAVFVPDIMEDCERKGVRAVIILSGGFSEEGEEGEKLEKEVVQIGRRAGIRIIGPNTTGIINTENGFMSSFTKFSNIIKGNVAFIAQTGNYGGIVLEQIFSSHLFGVSKVVGLGNKCDVDETEILEYLALDDKTQVIFLYVEGIKNGRRFLEVAKKITKKKPIIVVKGGKTDLGAKIALSHTASMAGRDEIFSAACKQAGVIRVSDFEKFLDLAQALSHQPLPKGNKVALIHFSGACLVLGTDMIIESGLKIAELSNISIKKLREITPQWHRVSNPIDIQPSIMMAGADRTYQVAVNTVIEDNNVDAVIVGIGAVEGNCPDDVMVLGMHKEKPILFCLYGNKSLSEKIGRDLRKLGYPVYDSLRRAVDVLSVMCQISKRMNLMVR